MSQNDCRLCHGMIDTPPLLTMAPFPKAAQHYPEPNEFASDQGINLEIHGCLNCGLLQLSSHPVPYYREVITAASYSADARAARLREFGALVERFCLYGKPAIEIGSGKGSVVEIMVEAGLDAVGLEYSADSVAFAAEQGRPLVQGYLTELDASFNGRFDAFVSLNYIEHQPDTRAFIQALRRITREGAVGYITAPNVSYLLKTNTLYEFVADHLVYFTEETFRRAFECNGFEVLESQLINDENDIALILRKRVLQPITGADEVNRLALSLSAFVAERRAAGGKVAVWGAGHRTLALLAMAQLGDIEFIVDSADFKQGKFSPVMHSRIVAPTTLAESNIDTVIVMVPGLYPGEVIKTIRGLGRPFDIYKLHDNRLVQVKA
ncbi:MAG: methyltransferase domain-containing protein [Lamprobacter sp.]|uniref:methyltransferase domain-containing protein n=1 Tax=Lamprobacter sp. TaxID=3100796 RepID=UPI002B25E862|nr:methyltransferase domain-containing protein [Lamprobacter sp.]MEA3641488.1 methyltransferase domain-containing protein [Lamprobacter sp.]